ncbi:hypothetical protein ACT7C9_09115 [Bacillus cereus]
MENNNFEVWTDKYFKKVVANMKDEGTMILKYHTLNISKNEVEL